MQFNILYFHRWIEYLFKTNLISSRRPHPLLLRREDDDGSGVTPCELWPRGRLRQHDDDDIPPFSSPHYRYFWIQRILSSPLFLLDLLQLPSLSHRRVAAESLPDDGRRCRCVHSISF